LRYLKKRSFICPHCSLNHDEDIQACPKTGEKLSAIHKMGGSLLDGKYRVEVVLGAGGMGVVYEGRHKLIDRKVAIKFLAPETCGSPEVRQRFINEARIAASLGHKNITAVLDMGETSESVPYIVMEHLQGESLGDLLERDDRLSVLRAVDITIQVLDGLHAVHSEGIIHRDLKPENVFLALQSGGEEIVKLLDFGISRLSSAQLDQASRLTEAGKVYGTPYYVSPEQAEGRLDVDHRADLYSVGIILYEMTTGRLPFRSTSYATLMVDIITKPPPDPRDYLPELPVDLVAVINQALSKSPSMRFENAQHMSQALSPLMARVSASSSRSHAPSQPPPPRLRHSTPEQVRDSLTGYRIVSSTDSDGPLARARKRRSSKPPTEDPRDVPSPPSAIEVNYLTDDVKRPSDPPPSRTRLKRERERFLSETKPIPRSDPKRKTPVVAPEDGDAMREQRDDREEEPKDEIDKGWDL
jgi:serine/threonine-protein kinase